jgi:hypothetical protein
MIEDGELVAFDVGPDGVVYLVVALRPLDYRFEQPTRASFAKPTPEQSQRYRVVGLSGFQIVLDAVIEGERFNIHHVQPLRDELLLVSARSKYNRINGFEKNGRVHTRNGEYVRDLLLGDAIESVQTTSKGVIWTSFFDEGLYEPNPGTSGLVCWDYDGHMLFDFKPSAGLKSIYDCYALNVESERDAWCYYYNQFPLVHLHFFEIESVWHMPIDGSDAFAIGADHALFRGGYNDRDTYHLFSLGPNGKVSLVEKLELRNEIGNRLVADWVAGRADAIYLASKGFLYRVDLQAVMAG